MGPKTSKNHKPMVHFSDKPYTLRSTEAIKFQILPDRPIARLLPREVLERILCLLDPTRSDSLRDVNACLYVCRDWCEVCSSRDTIPFFSCFL
jgi:hypothetical protein